MVGLDNPPLVPAKIVTAINGRFPFVKMARTKVVGSLGVFYHSKRNERDCKIPRSTERIPSWHCEERQAELLEM